MKRPDRMAICLALGLLSPDEQDGAYAAATAAHVVSYCVGCVGTCSQAFGQEVT